MGEEVARLHRRAAVAPTASRERAPGSATPGAGASPDFGSWFARERSLRGISVEFVAARLKLEPEQVEAFESGTEQLGPDGRSRSTARALALAIGADPVAAVDRLGPRSRGTTPRSRPRRVFTGAATGTAALLVVSAVLGGLWATWERVSANDVPGPRAEELVYRPDYVGELLTERGVSSVERRAPVGETASQP